MHICCNSKEDPTNTAGLRRQAFSEIRKRLRGAYQDARAYLEGIPTRFTEVPDAPVVNRRVYNYDLTDRDVNGAIAAIIESWFETGASGPPPRWFMGQFVGQATRSGTAQEASRIQGLAERANISAAELGAFDTETVLQSRPFFSRIARVESRAFEEMAGFTSDTATDLARTLSNGVARGIGPRQIAREIRDRFEVSQSRAEGIARTEIGHAFRDARRETAVDARDRLGLDVRLQHISALAPTTRPSHAERHLQVYTAEEVADFYSRDANSLNCFIPGTRVSGNFTAGSKAYYRGVVINIVTAGGRALTVTPNHPVMTDRGLIPAAEITESCNLIANRIKRPDFAGVCPLDGDLVDAKIEDVFCSLVDLGHSYRSRVGAVDFHGDSAGMDKYVDIVDAKGVLNVAIDAHRSEALKDLSFVKSNPVTSLANGDGSCNLGLLGISASTPSIPGGMGYSDVVFPACPAEPLGLSLLHSAPAISYRSHSGVNNAPGYSKFFSYGEHREPRLMESNNILGGNPSDLVTHSGVVESASSHSFADHSGGNRKLICDLLKVHSGVIELDQVITVSEEFFSGHVYDLQEVSGLMIANDIITSNCLCVQQSVVVTDDGEAIGKRTR